MKAKDAVKLRRIPRTIVAPIVRPKLQKILATTDFSKESLPAVRYAMSLKCRSVALLHVVEPIPPFSGMESMALAQPDSEVKAWALRKLHALAKKEAKGRRKIVSSVRLGKPFHEIALAAGENAVDLIVIATHGHTGFKRFWLGSTAERVARYAPCSVLTVPARLLPAAGNRSFAFRPKRILVPIDFSILSKNALPYAAWLAKRFGAKLTLLHIVQRFPIEYLLDEKISDEDLKPDIQLARTNLKHLAAEVQSLTRVKTSSVVGYGTPFVEICRIAKTLRADVIALTTHGYTGLKHVWLGSTAERVVRHANCPVLVVRTRGRVMEK